MDRLVVLGGSSPFTAGLVDALVEARPSPSPQQLVLQGRNTADLELLARYAARRLEPLGWRVEYDDDMAGALDHARIVIHQNRYGGFEGRRQDEAFAARLGVSADETLGPAALNTILRSGKEIRAAGESLARLAGDAWVLNLTNPLSVATSILAESGLSRCLGVCELPRVTAQRAARRIGLPVDSLDWHYVGLNHRGFVVRLRQGSRDLIPVLVRQLGNEKFEGIPVGEIEALHAIPTKYFRLLRGGGPATSARAVEVDAVRRRIRAELEEAPDLSPPSLRDRYMEWYPQAVVPLIRALGSDDAELQVVNLSGADGICRELHARVSRAGVEPIAPPSVSTEVARWLELYERHEKALMEFSRSPQASAARRAVETDPLVHPTAVERVVTELEARLSTTPDE